MDLLGPPPGSSPARIVGVRRKWWALCVLVLVGGPLLWTSLGETRNARPAFGIDWQWNERQAREAETMVRDVVSRTAVAMRSKPIVQHIVEYADQTILLQDLYTLEASLQRLYPGMNETAQASHGSVLQSHFNELFNSLFPWFSPSSKDRRMFDELRAKHNRPKGIVMPVGGEKYFAYAVHMIATLKYVHRTRLPIQIVYAGDNDLPQIYREKLRSIHSDVEFLDVLNFFDEKYAGLGGGGWAIKPFALLATDFIEVIYVDADVVFFQDPELILDDPGYIKTGTKFWHDRQTLPGEQWPVHSWWHKIMEGRKPSQQMLKSTWWTENISKDEAETGVMAFDKGRWDVLFGLVFVGQLMTKVVRDEVIYPVTWGDKEAFWMAFELIQVPYHFSPGYGHIVGELFERRQEDLPEGVTNPLMHVKRAQAFRDQWGKPLWLNGGLRAAKDAGTDGWFFATHWGPGNAKYMWDLAGCMYDVDRDTIMDFSDGWDTILHSMIGEAMFWESRFPDVIPQHYR